MCESDVITLKSKTCVLLLSILLCSSKRRKWHRTHSNMESEETIHSLYKKHTELIKDETVTCHKGHFKSVVK